MAEVIVKDGGLEAIEIFGEVDKVNGKVGSEYPAWYFEPQTQEIKEEIRRLEHSLKEGLIPEKGKPAALADMRRFKEKLDKIEEARPDITDKDKDAINKATKDLGEKLAASMPSLSDEKKGLVDPHDVVERMTTPCIKLSNDQLAMAKKMGCRISRDGEVSGNDASRVWKTYRRMIGESSNTEKLRRV